MSEIYYYQQDALQFKITDAEWDGICCGYGQGSYSVSVDGEIVQTGGDFGRREELVLAVGLSSYTSAPLDANAGEVQDFVLIPSSGTINSATCSMAGSGDADLYASLDHENVVGYPDESDCAPYLDATSNEMCSPSDFPNFGSILFVSVHAYSSFSNVQLFCSTS